MVDYYAKYNGRVYSCRLKKSGDIILYSKYAEDSYSGFTPPEVKPHYVEAPWGRAKAISYTNAREAEDYMGMGLDIASITGVKYISPGEAEELFAIERYVLYMGYKFKSFTFEAGNKIRIYAEDGGNIPVKALRMKPCDSRCQEYSRLINKGTAIIIKKKLKLDSKLQIKK